MVSSLVFCGCFVSGAEGESRCCYPGIYNDVYGSGDNRLPPVQIRPMTLSIFRIPAAFVLFTALPAGPLFAQAHPSVPASPYGGTTVEEIIARVNDQVITTADFQRAMEETDQEERQHGATMQQISEAHKDLLRNLIDQQLWLSKGKELGITGETELVNKLNEIRKQYNLSTLEDLEKAAKEQGFSYEDFKANLRNQIITQQVMRDQVGRKINVTPGEVQRYFEEHKQEYAQQESVKLSEILISTGTPGAPGLGDDPQKVADAQAKANDIEAKLRAGGDFGQLARSSSEGTTASEGGDLGTYKRGQLNPVFEEATFPLKTGDFTQPIRTKQGFVILKVVDHIPGGIPAYKDVETDVENNYYMSRMEPAVRDYLTQMRDDASIEIKTGYVDSGASPNKQIFPIAYSAYTPPSPKKKRKIERTRFRETTHTFRQKSKPAELASTDQTPTPPAPAAKKASKSEQASEKPGKKEKIRFGKAPTKTLPSTPASETVDAGAETQTASTANEPANPLENAEPPARKTRFSARAKQPKPVKTTSQQRKDAMAPQGPDAAEVADRQTQSAPLGLNGDKSSKKKKKDTTTGEKTRLSDKTKKSAEEAAPPEPTPVPPVPGAPAPAAQAPSAPAPQQ
jgi:peptidyl-prolyl cis-trans isomerase SurA